ATDTAGNISSVKEVVVLDVTAPSIPSVSKVTEQSTTVTGTAEAAAKITIKNGNKELGTAIVNAAGKYSVAVPKQKAGTVLSVTAIDKVGNTSTTKNIKVIDETPPAVPSVNAIGDS